ncbi:hypothetical protein GGR56DRAFT_507042 [Xylariaceae sp. FL0804]|nr:hypothetical protein GGR56DRAFT_507042 [Xylariaceae sp. FL0804]
MIICGGDRRRGCSRYPAIRRRSALRRPANLAWPSSSSSDSGSRPCVLGLMAPSSHWSGFGSTASGCSPDALSPASRSRAAEITTTSIVTPCPSSSSPVGPAARPRPVPAVRHFSRLAPLSRRSRDRLRPRPRLSHGSGQHNRAKASPSRHGLQCMQASRCRCHKHGGYIHNTNTCVDADINGTTQLARDFGQRHSLQDKRQVS